MERKLKKNQKEEEDKNQISYFLLSLEKWRLKQIKKPRRQVII